jgi:hypothetical protein
MCPLIASGHGMSLGFMKCGVYPYGNIDLERYIQRLPVSEHSQHENRLASVSMCPPRSRKLFASD